ncbi:MAG: STAS domain-containing protein [Thermaerobacter sp.]|nr:STAS domain-containing protein [Thermaerobacter sp.]
MFYRVEPHLLTVGLEQDLDLATAPAVRAALDTLLDRYPDRDVRLDLDAVSFLDSTGLGVVLGRYRRLAASGRTLHLVGVRPAVAAVLTVAGVRQIMTWDPAVLNDGRKRGGVADDGGQLV